MVPYKISAVTDFRYDVGAKANVIVFLPVKCMLRKLRPTACPLLICRRYDVKSVSPRHVEALLVDSLRLGDPAEVRRVLEGHPGLPKERKQFPENSETRHQASEGDHTAVNDDLEDEHFRNHTDAQGSDDSSNMPELLAALSRAIEEEIRGTKGLFGLETGVLERLKSGTRVTPFLRHGSVRRQGTAGPVPHGLAAGGMKKWWRCPKCHMSQARLT